MANPVDATPWPPEQVETMGPGLVCEWYCDRRIIVYRLTSIVRETLNAWVDTVAQRLQTWPKDRPYLALHDISSRRVGLSYLALVNYQVFNLGVTASGWEKVEPILAQRPNFSARVALLFGLTHSGHLGQVLTQRSSANTRVCDITFQSFFDREQALNWLLKINCP